MAATANTKLKYNTCQKNIDLTGRSAHSFLNKITAYCSTSTTIHTKYAGDFSKNIDGSYVFDSETYRADSAITLYCTQCKQKYVYCCGRNHIINNSKVTRMKKVKA